MRQLTFSKLPQFFGSEDPRGSNHIIADDPIVRVVGEAWVGCSVMMLALNLVMLDKVVGSNSGQTPSFGWQGREDGRIVRPRH